MNELQICKRIESIPEKRKLGVVPRNHIFECMGYDTEHIQIGCKNRLLHGAAGKMADYVCSSCGENPIYPPSGNN